MEEEKYESAIDPGFDIEGVKDIEKIYKEDDKVKDAIRKYYADKYEYEEKIQQIKENILKNIHIKQMLPKCLFCNRSVGMIFSTEISKNGSKILSAVCGDTLNPCKEKIRISTGKMTSFMNKIREYEDMLNKLKIKVILFKNDLLFGYITEANIKSKFEDLKFRIDKCSLELQIIKELYLKNVDNYENYEELCKLEQQSYGYIEEIKTRIHNYKVDTAPSSDKMEDIDELMDTYTRSFIPLLKTLMKLKYSINEVDYYPDDEEFRLIQIKQQYDISENEYSELPIEIMGSISILRKPVKSKKPKTTTEITHTKTLKKPKQTKAKTKTFVKPILENDENEGEGMDELREFIPTVPEEEPEPTFEKGEQMQMGIEGVEEEKGGEEEKGAEMGIEEEIINPSSIMRHEIKQKIIHSNIDEDELKLVFDIPQIVEREHMFNERIIFRCSSNSLTAPPGEGEGEEIPEDDKAKFKELSKIKDWRKKIANFWTGAGDWSAEFTLDGKRWKSVEHYYQASKFKYGHPEFYDKFSLDYEGESVEGHPELVISQKPSLAKHAGTDGFYEGIRIRPEGVEIDDDFLIPTDRTIDKEEEMKYRQNYELFAAQKAKFTTNGKMRTLLLATKDAKLTHSYKAVDTNLRIIEPFYYLIYIRHLLQKANI